MDVSEIIDKFDTLIGQSVMASGYLTLLEPILEGPWYIRPTQESEISEGSIQIDLTNMNRELDERAGGIKKSVKDRDLTARLLAVPVWEEFSLDPSKSRDIGAVEISGRLASPTDPGFAASLTDLTSIRVLRPDHVYRFRQGIELSEFLIGDAMSVSDALMKQSDHNQQQACVTGILTRTGKLIYIAPDRSSMSDMSRCILLDPAIYDSLLHTLPPSAGGTFSYDYDAQIVGQLTSESPEPFPAILKEIAGITLQHGPFCVISWGPKVGARTAHELGFAL